MPVNGGPILKRRSALSCAIGLNLQHVYEEHEAKRRNGCCVATIVLFVGEMLLNQRLRLRGLDGFGQGDDRLLGGFVDSQGVADGLHFGGLGRGEDRFDECGAGFPVFGAHFDLDELMSGEGDFGFGQYRVGPAVGTQQDHRVQVVAQAAQKEQLVFG